MLRLHERAAELRASGFVALGDMHFSWLARAEIKPTNQRRAFLCVLQKCWSQCETRDIYILIF